MPDRQPVTTSLPLLVLLLGALACGKPAAPAAPEPAPPAAKPKAAPAAPAEPPATSEGLTVKVLDAQLFHPYSRGWQLTTGQDEAKVMGVAGANGSFGFAVLVEATNGTGEMLRSAHVAGDFNVHVKGGLFSCKLSPVSLGWYAQVLSFDPTATPTWRDEERAFPESFWRPKERIRVAGSASCGQVYALDLGLERFEASFRVVAQQVLGSASLASGPLGFSLPGSAGAAQLTSRGGQPAVVSGDVLVWNDAGTPRHGTVRELGPRADQLARTEVPPATPAVEGTAGGVRFAITGTRLVHWADGNGIPKGKRVIQGQLALSLDLAAADAEAQAKVAAAAKDAEAADAASAAAAAALKEIQAEPARKAELGAARTQVATTAAAARKAAGGLAAAKAEGSKARAQAARAFDCGKLVLVTNRRVIVPAARVAGALATVCRDLATAGKGVASLEFLLERYEVPVAYGFRAGGNPGMAVIASGPLTGFDPR